MLFPVFVLPFDEPQAATAGAPEAEQQILKRGDLVEFSIFVNRVKRGVKRAGRISLLSGALRSVNGTVAEMGDNQLGWVQPVAAGPGVVAGAVLVKLPFSMKQAMPGHQIRTGDDVEFLVAEPVECRVKDAPPLVDTQRAVGVALVLGSTDSAGKTAARMKRQLSVNKIQYK